MYIPRASSSDSALESIGKMAVSLFAYFLVMVSKGWAVSILWNWFIAAPFNAPKLSILMAIGVSFVYAAVTGNLPQQIKQARADDDKWSDSVCDMFAAALVGYPIAVAIGWIIHSFL